MNHALSATSKLLAMSILVAASVVCFGQGAGDARAAIEKANKEFVAAVKRGDATALSNMYTANATALPPDAQAVSGRAQIAALWKATIDSGVRDLELITSEVETHGDTAVEVGNLRVLGADGAPVARGKYVVVWKREDGAWKLHRDIWNMDAAPPAATKAESAK